MVLLCKDDDGNTSFAGWNTTEGKLKIENDSTCTLIRSECSGVQIKGWDKQFPEKIGPNATVDVNVEFVTKSKTKYENTFGDCVYVVYNQDDVYISEFQIHANASGSGFGTFRGNMSIKWGNLTNVFGLIVSPVDGKIGFKHNAVVGISISGSPLPVADRVEQAAGRISDWVEWEELIPQLKIGDIVGANRGPIIHYGIVEELPEDKKVQLCHLNGTATALLKRHPRDAPKQVLNALRKHGDIAEVGRTVLEEFSNKDKVRLENAYDNTLKPFPPETIQERIRMTIGHKDYSLWEFNCEHFVHLMRYGVTYSGQVEEMRRLEEKFKIKPISADELLKRSISSSKELFNKTLEEARNFDVKESFSNFNISRFSRSKEGEEETNGKSDDNKMDSADC